MRKLSSEPEDEVSDTRDDAQGTEAGLIIYSKIFFDGYCQSIYLKQNFAV